MTIDWSKYNDKTPDGELADKTIKHCVVCNRCYDTRYYKDVVDPTEVIYYDDFPKFGKEKQTCKNCKEKQV
tara:strand:+ start:498 stop:710 length:213 start_codon:yes stop_codon:yes gene_type:complete